MASADWNPLRSGKIPGFLPHSAAELCLNGRQEPTRRAMTDEPIPQSDPRAGILALRSRIEIAIIQVIESGTYILGREVHGFEQEFSAFVGVSHGIAVASGTDALMLSLRALGLGPNDYVVTVSHSAVASVAAI